MTQAHDEGRHPQESLGALNPVGHVVLAFADDERRRPRPTRRCARPASPTQDILVYTADELLPRPATSMMRTRQRAPPASATRSR